MGCECSKFDNGIGRRNCRNTDFKGRIGVHEILVVSDEMRDAIVADPTIGNLREMASRANMITLAHDGFRKVREGVTTVEEILHVSGDGAGGES